MEATTQHEHHHELPTSGSALSSVALSATLHCLTGCAIGEITGMVIGTALGFSDLGTIALAVGLAFLFGYTLTSLPLLRAGLALGAVVPIALAADTISIAIMEVVDNGIMLAVPGAMDAGVGDILFWGALSVALVVAGAFAFPANRWMIARGKGHAVVHETGIHGGPSPRVVGAVAAVAAVFGVAVLLGELVNDGGGGGHGSDMPAEREGHGGAAESHAAEGGAAQPVRGLSATSNGMTLDLAGTSLERGQPGELRFRIAGTDGQPVRDYEVEHEKRMHLIVARRDTSEFQHLHPELRPDGTWSTPIALDEAGSYRVFADFKRGGRNETLAAELTVPGADRREPLPPESTTATAPGGYEVELRGGDSHAGEEAELEFEVTRNGRRIEPEPYLGARGHLVALRERDLAYLHVHPSGDRVAFETTFPSAARYRLFLQFRDRGRVHTAAFTRAVGS